MFGGDAGWVDFYGLLPEGQEGGKELQFVVFALGTTEVVGIVEKKAKAFDFGAGGAIE